MVNHIVRMLFNSVELIQIGALLNSYLFQLLNFPINSPRCRIRRFPPNARVAKLVDARDLNNLSTQTGNLWCEWSQIRGNLSTQ
jgi:hypothetical protein